VLRYRPDPTGYIGNIRHAVAVVWLRLPAPLFAYALLLFACACSGLPSAPSRRFKGRSPPLGV